MNAAVRRNVCHSKAMEIARDRSIVPHETDRQAVYRWFVVQLQTIAGRLPAAHFQAFARHNAVTLAGIVFAADRAANTQKGA